MCQIFLFFSVLFRSFPRALPFFSVLSHTFYLSLSLSLSFSIYFSIMCLFSSYIDIKK